MSSVLHPVGPEPRERYWVRRVAVLVAAIVAIGIVIALVGNAMSAGSAVQADPAPPTSLPPVVPVTPTPTPAASGTASPTPSASPTPGAPSPGAPTPTGSPTPSATASATPRSGGSTSKKTTEDSKKKKKVVEQPTYAACDASDLRPTLTGAKSVKTGRKTSFALSLINGSTKTCTVSVAPTVARLTVVSGGDRIWSTKDCPKAQATTKRTLLPEHALTWKVTWSGERSGAGCSVSKAAPKKGYYWAIASFDGAADVRFRVILT